MAEIGIETGPLTGRNEIRELIRDMGKVPAELRKVLRPRLREIGQPALIDARKRASWSTRIPGALRISTSFTKRRAGISLIADGERAPHARPLEGITGRGEFRHPVFGARDVWVAQRTRPFLVPAVEAQSLRIVAEMNKAVDEAARNAGFRD